MIIKLTNDVDLINNDDFKTIERTLQALLKSGMLTKFAGNCLSASEIIQGMLNGAGITSKVHEVQLFITTKTEKGEDWTAVGYCNLSIPNTIDTHVVVITQTKVPILIDVSVSHLLPQSHPFVVEKVNSLDPEVIANYEFENYKLQYSVKKSIKLPTIHQKSILEKAQEDQKLRKSVKLLYILMIFLVIMTLVNFSANSALLYLKLIYP